MKNLYSILNINKNATEKEIKDSYIKLIKIYTPEKYPQKFLEIREAYENLSNQEKKHIYDLELEKEDNIMLIKKLESDADKYIAIGDYEKAIKKYKKILIKDRNLDNIKYKLSKIFLKVKNLYDAELILKELKDGEYDKESRNYLIDIYFEAKNYKLLNDEIKEYLKKYDNSLKIVSYSLILIRNSSNKENIYDLLKLNIDKINNSINLTESIKEEFIIIAYKLYFMDMYDSVELISKKLEETGNYELKGIAPKELNENLYLKEEFFDFLEDTRIEKKIKFPIIYEMIYFEDKEINKKKNNNTQEITELTIYNPSLVIYSINILKKEYKNIYSILENLYLNIEKFANYNIEYETLSRKNFKSKKNSSKVNYANEVKNSILKKLNKIKDKSKYNIKESLFNNFEKGSEEFLEEIEKLKKIFIKK